MRKMKILGALLVAVALPTGAHAQETNADVKLVDRASVGPEGKMNSQFTSFAFKSLEGLVPPGKILRLMFIAKQRALATACEQFDVDESRYRDAMAIALDEVIKLTKEGENNLAVDRAMFGYATLLGGELAVSAYNPDDYCANGIELKSELGEKPEAKLLILKD